MKRKKPFWRRLTATASFFWIASLLTAQAPPGGEIPAATWEATVRHPAPAWFGPVQTAAATNMTVWRAAIRPPPGTSRLAVTLLFEETQGGFARLIWQGPNRAVTISPNLYEGAAPLHLRTLLLDRQTLAGPGFLTLEATGTRPVLVRAELAWVEPLVLAASGRTPPGLYLASSGKIFPSDEMFGQGRRVPTDEQKGGVVDAVLDAGPVKIEALTPVRFLAPISVAPSHARLEAQVAGLAPGVEPLLRINGRPLPAVSVELPGLEDAGYHWMPSGRDLVFGGWRKVTALVPPGWLTAGQNQVDWHCPSGVPTMTVRNLRLQVAYDPVPVAPAPSPAPAPVPRVASSVPVPAAAGRPSPPPDFRLGLSSARGAVNLRTE